MVYQGGLNAGVLSNGEPAGAGAIADHQRDLSAQRSLKARGQQRLEI
jgi:hypothetical protein